MKYLLTGFQAFGGDDLNPTELLLQVLKQDPKLNSVFETQLLPVEFNRAHEMILQRPDLDSFAGIFCFGLAGGRSKISLERVALNWIETKQPDNAGVTPPIGPIDTHAEKVFMSELDLQKFKKNFEAEGLKTEISLSAGGYVCNSLYFQLLKRNLNADVLFIHIPYLKSQVLNKPTGTPFIIEQDLKKILQALVKSLRAD